MSRRASHLNTSCAPKTRSEKSSFQDFSKGMEALNSLLLLCLDSIFYREIVAAAHLKPLDKGDKLQFEDKIVSPWNVAANGQTSVKLEQSTNQSEVSVPVAIRLKLQAKPLNFFFVFFVFDIDCIVYECRDKPL